ncbi:hypothetical protein [Dyella humicola]|uniref:hypothetical protein n=1 Tax=Dyella humicola TaxID=2992126 RepID=UPI00225AFAA1|nr:hypothetical protein [Dyella humicola]
MKQTNDNCRILTVFSLMYVATVFVKPSVKNHLRPGTPSVFLGSEADAPDGCHSARLALRVFSIAKRNEGENRDDGCRSERHSGSKEGNQETKVNSQHQAFDQDSDHRDRRDDRIEDEAA